MKNKNNTIATVVGAIAIPLLSVAGINTQAGRLLSDSEASRVSGGCQGAVLWDCSQWPGCPSDLIAVMGGLNCDLDNSYKVCPVQNCGEGWAGIRPCC
jgi:hypothetical protein